MLPLAHQPLFRQHDVQRLVAGFEGHVVDLQRLVQLPRLLLVQRAGDGEALFQVVELDVDQLDGLLGKAVLLLLHVQHVLHDQPLLLERAGLDDAELQHHGERAADDVEGCVDHVERGGDVHHVTGEVELQYGDVHGHHDVDQQQLLPPRVAHVEPLEAPREHKVGKGVHARLREHIGRVVGALGDDVRQKEQHDLAHLEGQMLADEGGDADEYGHAQRDLVEEGVAEHAEAEPDDVFEQVVKPRIALHAVERRRGEQHHGHGEEQARHIAPPPLLRQAEQKVADHQLDHIAVDLEELAQAFHHRFPSPNQAPSSVMNCFFRGWLICSCVPSLSTTKCPATEAMCRALTR